MDAMFQQLELQSNEQNPPSEQSPSNRGSIVNPNGVLANQLFDMTPYYSPNNAYEKTEEYKAFVKRK